MLNPAVFSDLVEKPKPASIEEGFQTLSKPAFALWIRLMVVPTLDLRRGRCHVIRCLGVKKSQFNVALRELSNKGYIRLIQSKGSPTQ